MRLLWQRGKRYGRTASLSALTALAADTDAEVRFSAVFELGTWWQAGHDPRIEAMLGTALQTGTLMSCGLPVTHSAIRRLGELRPAPRATTSMWHRCGFLR